MGIILVVYFQWSLIIKEVFLMSVKVGITERGDAGLDFSWTSKLLPANIIISKSINNFLIKEVIRQQEKIILHVTCTGFGASILEPNVPNKLWTRLQIVKLIAEGFPVEQLVLRIDPIIPTEQGINTAKGILDLFGDTGIKRVRYSFMDMYKHVKDRFTAKSLPLPYRGFCAPAEMINNALVLFSKYSEKYEFEACAENTQHKLGCISQKDFDIFGITKKAIPNGAQRMGCSCIAGKTELLKKRSKCRHGCIYCYWKD